MLSECGPLFARTSRSTPILQHHLASGGPSTRAPKLALSEVEGSGALAQDDTQIKNRKSQFCFAGAGFFSSAGLENRISVTSSIAPMTMALSATLNAGQ